MSKYLKCIKCKFYLTSVIRNVVRRQFRSHGQRNNYEQLETSTAYIRGHFLTIIWSRSLSNKSWRLKINQEIVAIFNFLTARQMELLRVQRFQPQIRSLEILGYQTNNIVDLLVASEKMKMVTYLPYPIIENIFFYLSSVVRTFPQTSCNHLPFDIQILQHFQWAIMEASVNVFFTFILRLEFRRLAFSKEVGVLDILWLDLSVTSRHSPVSQLCSR